MTLPSQQEVIAAIDNILMTCKAALRDNIVFTPDTFSEVKTFSVNLIDRKFKPLDAGTALCIIRQFKKMFPAYRVMEPSYTSIITFCHKDECPGNPMPYSKAEDAYLNLSREEDLRDTPPRITKKDKSKRPAAPDVDYADLSIVVTRDSVKIKIDSDDEETTK